MTTWWQSMSTFYLSFPFSVKKHQFSDVALSSKKLKQFAVFLKINQEKKAAARRRCKTMGPHVWLWNRKKDLEKAPINKPQRTIFGVTSQKGDLPSLFLLTTQYIILSMSYKEVLHNVKGSQKCFSSCQQSFISGEVSNFDV